MKSLYAWGFDVASLFNGLRTDRTPRSLQGSPSPLPPPTSPVSHPPSSPRALQPPTSNLHSPESGFTLAELAVGMFVSALVLGMAYATYLFAAAAFGGWQGRQAQAAYVLERRVAEDVRQAAAWTSVPEGFALLTGAGDTAVVYRMENGKLTRNGHAVDLDARLRLRDTTQGENTFAYVELALRADPRANLAPHHVRRITTRLRASALAPWYASSLTPPDL